MALALIPQGVDLSAPEIVRLLHDHFAAAVPGAALSVQIADERTVFVRCAGKWWLELHRTDDPSVAEESAALAAYYAGGRPDQARIAGCASRLEITSAADSERRFLPVYLEILQALTAPGLVLFDPESEAFLS